MGEVATLARPSGPSTALAEQIVAERAARGPSWLASARLEAWRRAGALPLPSPDDERWRRTDLALLDPARYTPLVGSSATVLTAAAAPDAGEPAALLVEVDGALRSRQLGEDARRAGVICTSLAQAATEHEELVRPRLGALIGTDELHGARSLALHGDGAFLHVPRGVELAAPVVLHGHLATAGAELCPRRLVIVGAGARVVLVEAYDGGPGDAPSLAAPVTEVFVGDGARVGWVTWQAWGGRVSQVAEQRARLGRDATLETLHLALGGHLARASLEVQLAGEGAASVLLGLTFARGRQQVEHWTVQDHLAPRTRSDLAYRGAIADEARSLYHGTIRVRPEAKRADAYQANRNLLLSHQARADTSPQLEIAHNDVRCTHGATVGPIDEQQLFYLMSRGVRRPEAARLIVLGFFQGVLDRARWSGMTAAIERALRDRAGESGGVGCAS